MSIHEAVATMMKKNRRTVAGRTYTVPSSETYPYQWFWDSCFHTIILSHLEPPAAASELETLVSAQSPDGFIGHVVYWKRQHILDVPWASEHTSDLIQPPLLAIAVERVYEKTQDADFLARVYEPMVRFYEFLLRERDPFNRHLIGLVNPDESGEDNSPRFDVPLALPPQHPVEEHLKKRYALFGTHKGCELNARCTSQHFWCEDVPMNTFLVWNLRALAALAREMNDATTKTWAETNEKAVAAAMREHLWNGSHFTPTVGTASLQVTEGTWSRFAPLLTRQYTKEEAARLIESELLNTETFWQPHGVPTTSVLDEAYDPEEPPWGEAWQHPHWRGPIWMASHWFLYQGLQNYGYTEPAEHIKERSLALLQANGFREYFHPTTGLGMGAHDFTWGGLVLDMQ